MMSSIYVVRMKTQAVLNHLGYTLIRKTPLDGLH